MTNFTKQACLVLMFFTFVSLAQMKFRKDNRVRGIINKKGELIPFTKRVYDEFVRELNFERARRNCDCGYCYIMATGQWQCCACEVSSSACFPATATVQLDTGSRVTMDQLETGNKVLTVDSSGKQVYSAVVSFLKKLPDQWTRYMEVTTESGQHITLSGSHLIYSGHSNNTATATQKFASDVKLGDYIFTKGPSSLDATAVTHIEEIILNGVYVPLTTEGTLFVDDVYTSCYASFDHDLAHLFMAPLRWFPGLFDWSDGEGMPGYVYLVKEFGRWFLPENFQDHSPRSWSYFTSVFES